MDPVVVGVSLALEAHKRRLLNNDRLQAVLDYYDGPGAQNSTSPALVLRDVGRLPEHVVLELIELVPLPAGHRRFTDRLTTHEVIGRGGMGCVYKGFDRLLKRVVALKVLEIEHVTENRRRSVLGRFDREARVMARLRHPAVAQLYDAGLSTDGNPYIAMELVAGRDMDALIQDAAPSGLEVQRVLRWGATLAEALHACHEAGVVHRDVKPSNVIVTPDDQVRLIDFGVAIDELAATRLTAENARVGTALYMAPEQANGERCDPRSDVYSLGATLYHALAGQPPFDAPNVVLLLDQIWRRTPAPLRSLQPSVPVGIEVLIHRCLEKSPQDRPADAATVAAEIRQLLAQPPVDPPKTGRRRSIAMATGAASVALALGGLALVASGPPTNLGTETVNLGTEPVIEAPRPEVRPVLTSSKTLGDFAPSSTQDGTFQPDPLPPGIERGVKPGEYVNTKDGSILVLVAGGTFLMGQPGEEDVDSGELRIAVKWNDRPAHSVGLSPYFIGRDEVTWKQYRQFVAARPTFALPPDSDLVLNARGQRVRASDDLPVFGITWNQARAYCEWAGLRLPTEAEWEFAARGPREYDQYPWGGNELRPGDANLFGDRDGELSVAPVGSFPRDTSSAGCRDMCGNVAEWVADIFAPYTKEPATDPRGPTAPSMYWAGLEGWRPLRSGEGAVRVIRGGAWTTWDSRVPAVDFYAAGAYFYQCTRRYAGDPDAPTAPVIGFRVSRDR